MDQTERDFITAAAAHFRDRGLLIRAANAVGKPVEMLVAKLPQGVAEGIARTTQTALLQALKAALKTTPKDGRSEDFGEAEASSRMAKWRHTALTTGTGAVSGFFGGMALFVELPVTTTIMLRQIAVTAQNYGEDVTSLAGQLECLNVFALSGASEIKEAGYYATRASLNKYMSSATEWAAKKTVSDVARAVSKGDAPMVFQMLLKIAERFELVVTEKALLQAIPVISAISGAFVNTVFTGHIGDTAGFHFGIRALERKYGTEAVRGEYGKNMVPLK